MNGYEYAKTIKNGITIPHIVKAKSNVITLKDGKQVIDNNTLVAITLLIAQSNPKEKGILVDLVMNFLSR